VHAGRRWHAACETSTRNATAEWQELLPWIFAGNKHPEISGRSADVRLKLNFTRSRAALDATGHSMNISHIFPDGLERQHLIERQPEDQRLYNTPLISNRTLTVIDISIQCDHLEKETLPSGASLRYLSIVETSRIPLYLSFGSPCTVCTSNADTQRWFSNVLLARSSEWSNKDSPWWREAVCDSPLGVLASLDLHGTTTSSTKPRATEVLFYASWKIEHKEAPPTPPRLSPPPTAESHSDVRLELNALILSSDLLQRCQPAEATPPCSPQLEPCEAVFLPNTVEAVAEVIYQPPVRKRRTANEAFDEANERRKKARRKGGEGIAAAAASKAEKPMPSLQHRHSGSMCQMAPLQTRTLSRSPSVVSTRPNTANRPSTLFKTESTESTHDGSIETKNKDIVSRIVMTGMRLHGLTQSRKRRTKDATAVPSPAGDESEDIVEAQRQNDEEYKVIYHQVFRSTCVTFRASIRQENLQLFSTQIRDVVDQLLVILCTNPLENGLGPSDSKLTPGGRKAFAVDTTKEAA
jgi:hypothetical protein